MNFPVGAILNKGNLPLDMMALTNEFLLKKFNGYIIQTVKGEIIEEGALFFRDGGISACIVECLSIKQTIKGSAALEYFLNQTMANGFFQVVELTRSQVDLVEAFDETIMIREINLKELPKLIPSRYAIRFRTEGKKENILDRYGLSDLKK
jgi:hypothetical protein